MDEKEKPSITNDVLVGRITVTRDTIELEPNDPLLRTQLEQELGWFLVIPEREGQPELLAYLPKTPAGAKDVQQLLAGSRAFNLATQRFDEAWPRKFPSNRSIVARAAKQWIGEPFDPNLAWAAMKDEFGELHEQNVSLRMISQAGRKAYSHVMTPQDFSGWSRGYIA